MRKALNGTVLPSPRNKQEDNLECGLRALASMIATAYRRRVIGETDAESFSSTNYEDTFGLEKQMAQYTYPEDLRHEGEYTETVKVENFLRRKAPQVKKSRTREVAEVNE